MIQQEIQFHVIIVNCIVKHSDRGFRYLSSFYFLINLHCEINGFLLVIYYLLYKSCSSFALSLRPLSSLFLRHDLWAVILHLCRDGASEIRRAYPSLYAHNLKGGRKWDCFLTPSIFCLPSSSLFLNRLWQLAPLHFFGRIRLAFYQIKPKSKWVSPSTKVVLGLRQKILQLLKLEALTGSLNEGTEVRERWL